MEEVRQIVSKPVPVLLKELHVRYIPVVTPINTWNYDMSLVNSPHVELMMIFKKHGCDWNIIEKSRYFSERIYRSQIGMKRWTEGKIAEHIKDRYKIFKSIKKHGYDASFDKHNPIKVLHDPFWKTRFDAKEEFLKGPEIWNGAGRCSAAYVLGYRQVKALWCADTRPHTKEKGKFASKLRDVRGVW